MALSINQILAASKIPGLQLAKISSEGGNYFVAEYKGFEKSIMVNSIAQMDRRQWVETLLSFVTAVMQNDTADLTEVGVDEPSWEEKMQDVTTLNFHDDKAIEEESAHMGAEETPAEAPVEAPVEATAEELLEAYRAEDRKPLALKLVYNVDLSITIFAARKKVYQITGNEFQAERLEAFLEGWFGSHPRHIRRKFRDSKRAGK